MQHHHSNSEEYRALINRLPVAVFRAGAAPEDGELDRLNPAMRDLLDAEEDTELTGRPVRTFYGDPTQHRALIDALNRDGEVREFEATLITARGREIEVTITAHLRSLETGRQVVEGVMNDVTATREREEVQHQLLELLDQTPDFVSFADTDCRIQYINSGGRRMVGLPELDDPAAPQTDLNDVQVTQWRHPDWASRLLAEEGFPEAERTGLWYGETAVIDSEGKEIPTSQILLAHRDRHGRLVRFSTIIRDISERKELEERLRELAIHDPLTGVFNRSHLDQRLSEEHTRFQRHGNVFSIVLVDIDHFKSVNDEYGHSTGDRVIQQITRFLSGVLREIDILGRWGGEEFLIVLPGTPRDQAREVADRLRRTIAEATFPEVDSVTLSAGVAEIRAGDEVHNLVDRADRALYQAKALGRDQTVA